MYPWLSKNVQVHERLTDKKKAAEWNLSENTYSSENNDSKM